MKTAVLSMLFGLLGAVIFGILNAQFNTTTFGVVKLDQIIADHLKQYGGQELAEKDRQAISEEFAKKLDKAIKDISEDENVILLVAPAVISEIPDYSQKVRDAIGGIDNEKK